MSHINRLNLDILEHIIVWRVEPQIYAFTTQTIPNYLKIGDTYRPVERRLNEWRKYFPNLEKKFQAIAKVSNETFFRDYAIHFYLENESRKSRLKFDSIKSIPYYSNEFFRDTSTEDIDNAIKDIKDAHMGNSTKYQYYTFSDSRLPKTHTYKREATYEPRPNQQETIERFRKALKNWRKNLLMYAVMRFWKSFTSMCCAVEMDAKTVLIVSGKADVKAEWKKTVQSHMRFEEYSFIDADTLLRNDTVITETLQSGKKVVIFLTLQDLQGGKIKTKHAEIFTNTIDLLLIDETHFGARASEYGKVLNISKKDIKNESELNDVSIDDLTKYTKSLNARVRIHLSGTPYRILMNSEFTEDDIIAFYQFSDIAADQQKWNDENLMKDEVKEWDNPYYGFPQMIRFAFHPNESSQKKMEQLKRDGVTYAFSELLRPKSILQDSKDNLHKKFIYEKEIKDLLDIIDGSKNDDNILGFLDYERLKEWNMCRHIVCVLPYRASCDALEALIHTHQFKNLSSYEIINISGLESTTVFKEIESIQEKIKKCESEQKKTITLTVNRMLTGSTVPEWDTMLFLKDTTSPQEYDQAIFRLQNQYIRDFKEPNGDIVKYNMKPQTLLVDFSPNRMFQMQEQKAQIYNVNTEANGNTKLEERIRKELEISPIIVLNNHKMEEITPASILDAVREYSSSRSVLDEANAIAIDYTLLDIEEIRVLIEDQGKIGSRQGIQTNAAKGEWRDMDTGDILNRGKDLIEDEIASPKKDADIDYKSKFATYYSRILFFAFLTDARVISLEEVIARIKNYPEDLSIAKNLKIDTYLLGIFQEHINPFVLSEIDYKIQNINSLANDTTIPNIQRAQNAMKKFGRLSESEIVTPEHIADDMIDIIPDTDIDTTTKWLDIASKQGEFVYAIYKKYGEEVANNVYSIPSSKIAYEFTKKLYSLLGLNKDHIEQNYTAYDLIKENTLIEEDTLKINHIPMKFDIVIGNPPYQEGDGWAQASAKPIYQNFVYTAKRLTPRYISMIMPSRWFAGGKWLDEFRESMLWDTTIALLHDYINPDDVFPWVNLRSGVCYFLKDSMHDTRRDMTRVVTHQKWGSIYSTDRLLRSTGSETFVRQQQAIPIIDKVSHTQWFESFSKYVSVRKPFNIEWNIVKTNKFQASIDGLVNPISCYGKWQKVGYIERSEISVRTNWIDAYKVYTPRANNIGTELSDDNLNTFIGVPWTICTESYIVLWADMWLDVIQSKHMSQYLTTRFARFMHSLAKASQDATAKTYKFVPLQNFTAWSDINWSLSINDIDKQLYKKYHLAPEEIVFIESMIKEM